jgi:hypothetical protein
LLCSVPIRAKSPAAEAKSPATGAKSPAAGAKSPATGAKSPAAGAKSRAAGAESGGKGQRRALLTGKGCHQGGSGRYHGVFTTLPNPEIYHEVLGYLTIPPEAVYYEAPKELLGKVVSTKRQKPCPSMIPHYEAGLLL